MNNQTNLTLNPFKAFNDEWALVTCGTKEKYNCMTVEWGGLGYLWHMNVATIYVKPIRYTCDLLLKNEYFTISFFDEEYRDDLKILGSKSGRDCDKLALTKLTPNVKDNYVTYNQANKTIICKKKYMSQFDPNAVPEDVHKHYYEIEAEHYIIIGEVVEIQENNKTIYKKNED